MTTEQSPRVLPCPSFLAANEVFREINRARDEGHRARVSGNEADLTEAIRRLTAAQAKMRPCVIDAPHPPPHRTVDGEEWGHVEPEPEMVELPTVEALAAWLAEMEESYDNHDAAPEMTTSIDVDVSTLAERIVERLRQGA